MMRKVLFVILFWFVFAAWVADMAILMKSVLYPEMAPMVGINPILGVALIILLPILMIISICIGRVVVERHEQKQLQRERGEMMGAV